ncbi:helix-turn-helix domain-containing protein [Nocardioides sp. AE5]|uniref:helix-turn-helix domain-containing protein n=1 Tax=Nocardioides sp. AE5 TaxID=2962573 RepID=UPI002881AA63|nr:helix-turn-helix domain-containing protein [Nocardioides sp. AE5]MDT0203420.1 helix-turn-helix domain-containing protein [Nocardioides sp. AE5]
MSAEDVDSRGILYPARLPTFHRVPAPPVLSDRVRWFWIPEWDLAPGRTSRQEILPFPASNLVVQSDGVTVAGPCTRRSHRDLIGSGWAVGALLRPAAVPTVLPDPGLVRDQEIAWPAPDLHRAVVGAMADRGATPAERRATAVAAYVAWLLDHLPPVDDDGELANAMEDVVAGDRAVVRVEQVAAALGVSTRTLQRLARRHVGLPPLAMIRRHRLQEAAHRLREEPGLGLARVAAELGYADQAHLARDFRTVLGLRPGAYRSEVTLPEP